jgi:DinB superfamily
MIKSREDIAAALSANFTAFAGYVAACNETSFLEMPGGKWSAGQHLEHLIRSSRPVHMAIGLPAFLLRLLFGKPGRKPRDFEQFVLRYKEKLAQGGAASGRFVPPAVPYSRQQQKIQQFLQLKDRLQQRVLALSDQKLDNCLLPHPLLGKVTVREMLFFTVYHTQHHLQIIQKQNGK